MLYDKRWEKPEVKADPLKMATLVAWLETMPADRTYDYWCEDGSCLYGLYMATHGFTWETSGACGRSGSSEAHSRFCYLVYEHVASDKPWTFGAALDRARAALNARTS